MKKTNDCKDIGERHDSDSGIDINTLKITTLKTFPTNIK
ncbi:hypothetical protein MBBTH_14870 [Methanobrevibacter thaueri]|uniref:Uncharacterized protein n=1 Tax=Methanobrevibacter thaueri TaxID=190975 RepID=A0A315XL40_9EURY|nr:hypothetical protein MBBTH_14870 [Methanobrevibacter thaueri]